MQSIKIPMTEYTENTVRPSQTSQARTHQPELTLLLEAALLDTQEFTARPCLLSSSVRSTVSAVQCSAVQ
jgi:hypothetical protein